MLEHLRPTYHFTPEQNWMNDPNGLCYIDGEYHLFFQHNPNADVWGDIHWGHAVSHDLIHWRRLPIALTPSVELGEKHCYSGSVAIDGGVARAFYTSVGEGARGPELGAQQWMAYSTDQLRTWHKYEHNPILPEQINGDLRVTFWRDPFVWRDRDGAWYAVLGGTLDGANGCMLLYRSDDLFTWRFLSVITRLDADRLLECPNLIRIGDRYVMLYSPVREIRYRVGTLDADYAFHAETEGVLDGGSGRHGFYAPTTFMNLPDERRVVIGWMSDKGREEQPEIRGWSGAQSLPRVLTLDGARLRVDFARECELLREGLVETFMPLSPKAEGWRMEFGLTLTDYGRMRMTLLQSPNGAEETALCYDAQTGLLTLDRSRSTRFNKVDVTALTQFVPHDRSGLLRLRVFVDGSVIECCANKEVMLSGRVYPTDSAACRHAVTVSDGMRLEAARAWRLEKIF